MRIILLLFTFLIFVLTDSYAQVDISKAFYEDCYFVRFELDDAKDNQQFCLDVIFEKDTIAIDITDTETCLRSILSNGAMIPDDKTVCKSHFMNYLNIDKDHASYYDDFLSLLNSTQKYEKTEYIHLKSGEIVKYYWRPLTCLLINIDKVAYFRERLYNSDVIPISWICNMVIPIALIGDSPIINDIVFLQNH